MFIKMLFLAIYLIINISYVYFYIHIVRKYSEKEYILSK